MKSPKGDGRLGSGSGIVPNVRNDRGGRGTGRAEEGEVRHKVRLPCHKRGQIGSDAGEPVRGGWERKRSIETYQEIFIKKTGTPSERTGL